MSNKAAPPTLVTSPLVGEVGRPQAGREEGAFSESQFVQRPPSLTLPHKGGGNIQKWRLSWCAALTIICVSLFAAVLGAAW